MDLKLDLEKLLQKQKSCGASLDVGTNPNMLARRQVDALIDLVVDNSVLLKNIRVRRVDKCKGEIPRVDIAGIASQGANTKTCITERGIQDSYVTWDLQKYVTALSIGGDFKMCNEYGDRIEDIAVNIIRKQLGNDMERASIEGDSMLPTGDNQSDYNNLMGVNDGFIALAKCCLPECQIIDAAGAGPSPKLFMQARKKLPARYRVNRGAYRYIVGPQLFDWWAEERATRETTLGDDALVNAPASAMWGNRFLEVPLWPENFPYAESASQEVTHVLYTPLDNLLYFVQREMSMEWERVPRCDKWEGTMYWWADFVFENPDAVVLIKNIDPCGTAYDDCLRGCDTERTHNPGCEPEEE